MAELTTPAWRSITSGSTATRRRDYLELQVDILRKLSPEKAITHNDMGMFDGVDYSQLNAPLDFVAWDNYPMFGENYSDYFWDGTRRTT